MAEANWPIQRDAADFFSQQSRKMSIERRRPTPTRLTSLVGPNISGGARRSDDLNGELATYSGYLSVRAGTPGLPSGNPVDGFVTVINDPEMGGVQTFVTLETNTCYRRTYTRHPTDPSTIVTWSNWKLVSS